MDLKNLTPTSDTIEVILVHPNTLEPLMNEGTKKREMSITLHDTLPSTRSWCMSRPISD